MEVGVHDVLSPELPYIPPDVVAVRSETGIKVIPGLMKQGLRSRPLLCGQIKDGGAMRFRNDDAGSFKGAILAGFDTQEAQVILENEGPAPHFSKVAVRAGR